MAKSPLLSYAALSVVATLVIAPAAAWSAAEYRDTLDRPSPSSVHAAQSVLLALTQAERRLVAVGERGTILLSDDQGTGWRQAKVPVSVSLTATQFVSARVGWAVGHGGVVLATADGGETWRRQLDGRQAAHIELVAAKSEGAAGKRLRDAERLVKDGPDKPFLDLYFSDERNGLVIGAYGLIFVTTDGGQSWRSAQERLDNPKGRHLYGLRAVGRALYLVGEQGAVYRSDDGGQRFVELKTPYAGSYFGVVGAATGEVVVFGLRGHAYWSADAGVSWQQSEIASSSTLTSGLRLTDSSLLLVNESGQAFRSIDGGRSFKLLPLTQPSPYTGVAQAADGGLILSGVRGITRVAPAALTAGGKP